MGLSSAKLRVERSLSLRLMLGLMTLMLNLIRSYGQEPRTLLTPSGKVLLTISGRISTTNAVGEARFDLAMLERLAGRKTVTETPWTSGTNTFLGPLGSAILDAVGASGKVLAIKALNDYTCEIPVEDFRKWPVILATRMNDCPLTIRSKGPLFLIYPFDRYPYLYNEIYFNRSVWQVKSIEVR